MPILTLTPKPSLFPSIHFAAALESCPCTELVYSPRSPIPSQPSLWVPHPIPAFPVGPPSRPSLPWAPIPSWCMVLRNGKERLVLGRGSCPDILCLHSQPSIVTACSCFCLPGLCQCCSGSVLFPCAFPLKTAPCQEGWTFSDGLCWP